MFELLALPGTLLDGGCLAPALAGTAARCLVVGEEPQLDAELDRLAAQAHGRAVWLGHSLGGIVLLHLAVRHPQVVRALVLLAANARPGAATSATRRAAQWATAQQRDLRALATNELGPAYGVGDCDPLVRSLADQAESVGLRRFENQLRYMATRSGLLAPRRTLSAPMLVLSGGADVLCTPAQSDEIVALAEPGVPARHACLAGGQHLFPMQNGPWVAAHLQPFLAQHALASEHAEPSA
jgi:pimeloyl-ACP methyl ester carboxylesterase